MLNVRTGVGLKDSPLNNAIAISVDGLAAGDAEKVDIMQFVWAEVQVYKKVGIFGVFSKLDGRMTGVMDTSRGKLPLTTDLASPQLRLDTNINAKMNDPMGVYFATYFKKRCAR